MKKDLSTTSRILVAIASIALIAVFFFPAWQINLFAPQYPEGLTMNIWINGLSGDVDVINGLNHYIGMEKISEKMFPEFLYLPYVVVFFILLGILVSLTGRIKLLSIYLLLTVLGGALAMYDFYRWGYKYGHNLDPTAPIQVPGLSYQPPLLGHKRLLNFDAYSLPDVGGWVVIIAAAIAFTVWFFEWYRQRKQKPYRTKKLSNAIAIPLVAFILFSCKATPQPFLAGKDNCHFCKMAIADTRFGGELITKKGKIFKFDDIACLRNFLNADGEAAKNIVQTLTVQFDKPNEFIAVSNATFLVSAAIKSPMGSNTAGFSSNAAAATFATGKTGIKIINWQQVQQTIK
jgi:copper chaperone NosL